MNSPHSCESRYCATEVFGTDSHQETSAFPHFMTYVTDNILERYYIRDPTALIHTSSRVGKMTAWRGFSLPLTFLIVVLMERESFGQETETNCCAREWECTWVSWEGHPVNASLDFYACLSCAEGRILAVATCQKDLSHITTRWDNPQIMVWGKGDTSRTDQWHSHGFQSLWKRDCLLDYGLDIRLFIRLWATDGLDLMGPFLCSHVLVSTLFCLLQSWKACLSVEQTRSFSRAIQGHQEFQAYQEQMGCLGLKVTQGLRDPQVRKCLMPFTCYQVRDANSSFFCSI